MGNSGITCCTAKESPSSALDKVQRELDQEYYQTHINIKPLVNMIPLSRRGDEIRVQKRL